jgi:hypothetical protein
MCLGIMRGGQGIPSLPIRAIAVRALARKVRRPPPRRIFKMTRVRLQQLFLRLDQRGITTKVGRGSVEPADYLPSGGYPPAALPPSNADYRLPPLAPAADYGPAAIVHPTSPDPHRGSLPGTVGVQGYARLAQSYPWTASSVHAWKPSHAFR